MKRTTPYLGTMFGFMLLATACQTEEAEAPIYQMVPVTTRDIIVSASAAGTVEPVLTVEVKSKASGEILDVRVETGDKVTAGQLLVKVDPRIPANALRQAEADLVLDLYACIRPCRYIPGVPSPVKEPEKLDVVIFRENTEDVYTGVEWEAGTAEAEELIEFANARSATKIRSGSGIGIKPISEFGTSRLVRKAVRYAIDQGRSRVTLVHKGNIQKFTEGAFRDWGYQTARRDFPEICIDEETLWKAYGGQLPKGRILINDRIADSMFQQILLRPDEYDVLALPNLNGDYLSDACAAQVGGLGLAPGANIGDRVALFEATHGTAPKYAGQDKVNPGSLILSGAMLLEHIGWNDAAELVRESLERTIAQKRVTYDLERQMEGATRLKTSEFGAAIVDNMGSSIKN